MEGGVWLFLCAVPAGAAGAADAIVAGVIDCGGYLAGFLGGGEVVMILCGAWIGDINDVEIYCDREMNHDGGHTCTGPTAERQARPPQQQPPTLRDQFAMAALTSLVPLWESAEIHGDVRIGVATEAYAIADAMLIVRLR